MTPAETFLAHVSQHIGSDAARRKTLIEALTKGLQRQVGRGEVARYLSGKRAPSADALLVMLQWAHDCDIIRQGITARLFIYTKTLQPNKKAAPVAKKSAVSGRKLAAQAAS